MLWSWDARLALIGGGLIAAVAGVSEPIRDSAVTILLAEAGLGVALFAVVLAALAIFATFFDDAYRRVLEMASGSIKAALLPYEAVAVVAGLATAVALLVALFWPALTAGLEVVLLGLASALALWSVVGSVRLVELTTWHAARRADLMKGVEDAKVKLAERKRAARSA